MNLISDIRLRWYDDSSLLTDNPRALVDLFLDSIGVNSDVASDIFEVLLRANADGVSLTSRQIREEIGKIRGVGKGDKKGLTDRNIQIWLKFFIELKLLERVKRRYMFYKNKRPSQVFSENTKPLIDESAEYVERILKKLEDAYTA